VKRKKVIRIKDPYLRKIRYNLRMLIIKAVEVKNSQLRKEFSRLYKMGNKEEAHKVNKEIQKNTSDLGRSICVCEVCGTAKEDLLYIPKYKSWFCVACAKLDRISVPQ